MKKFLIAVAMAVLSASAQADCQEVTETAFEIYSISMKRVMDKEERYETYRKVWRQSEWSAELFMMYSMMAERMYKHNYDIHRMKAEAFQQCLEIQAIYSK